MSKVHYRQRIGTINNVYQVACVGVNDGKIDAQLTFNKDVICYLMAISPATVCPHCAEIIISKFPKTLVKAKSNPEQFRSENLLGVSIVI